MYASLEKSQKKKKIVQMLLDLKGDVCFHVFSFSTMAQAIF